MDNDLDKEVKRIFSEKTELERTISVGIQGVPDINHEEKIHFLGEFRERVLKILTKGQVIKAGIYEEITDSLKDPRASKMLINGEIDYKYTDKYRKIAVQLGKTAVDVQDINLNE